MKSTSGWDAGKIFWLLFSIAGGIATIEIGIRSGETLIGVFLSVFFWIPALQIIAQKADA